LGQERDFGLVGGDFANIFPRPRWLFVAVDKSAKSVVDFCAKRKKMPKNVTKTPK
jgi:hypothetical protein